MGSSIVTDVQVGQHIPPDMMKMFTIVMILLTWVMQIIYIFEMKKNISQ